MGQLSGTGGRGRKGGGGRGALVQAAAAAAAAEWHQPRSRGSAAGPQAPLDSLQSTDRQGARPAHPGWWERMDGGAGKPQGLPAHLPRFLQFE